MVHDGMPGITLGRLLGTPAALAAIAYAGYRPDDLLTRHCRGDRGEADHDAAATSRAIASAYRVANDLVWVLTEPAAGRTTVLLDDELRAEPAGAASGVADRRSCA